MEDEARKPESKFEQACNLIKTRVAINPVPSADIEKAAKEQDISMKTMNRAKDSLGVVSNNIHGRWCWQMPISAKVLGDGQGGQDSGMSNMSNSIIFPGGVVTP